VSTTNPTNPKKTGRRPGTPQTREAIAQAARTLFAEHGYERATIRKIAAAAGVDPALVVHFFGSKEDLFSEVMALPEAVGDLMAQIAAGERSTVGRRLAQLVVGMLENPATRVIVLGRIRSAATHPDAAALVRETVSRDLLRLATALGTDNAEMRASLVGSHLVGVAFARYIVQVEPLVSLDAAALVALLADDFQRCLVEPLPAVPR
jgi:AcrR family transcriptional regulator